MKRKLITMPLHLYKSVEAFANSIGISTTTAINLLISEGLKINNLTTKKKLKIYARKRSKTVHLPI